MAEKGAPLGNQNAAKGKQWTDALRYALENFESSAIKRGMALREIANKVVANALDGDKDCWQEIGNRLDGKPTNVIAGDKDMPPVQFETTLRPQLTKEEWLLAHHVGTTARPTE